MWHEQGVFIQKYMKDEKNEVKLFQFINAHPKLIGNWCLLMFGLATELISGD